MIEGSTPITMFREFYKDSIREFKTKAVINYFHINSGEWLEMPVDVSGLLYIKPDFCNND